tara:strand:+ start:142 stop:324 length:183 start_codon:yes stop_codon:yes gene_type:complete
MGYVISSFRTKFEDMDQKNRKRNRSKTKMSAAERKIDVKERLEAIQEERRMAKELDSYQF